MSVVNVRRRQTFVWIPPATSANYKITVERSNGEVDDVTQKLSFLRVEDGVTDSFGKFELEVFDPDESLANTWIGNEIVRYYKDYSSNTPTSLRFRGRIEKPSKRGNRLNCKGVGEGSRFLNTVVTQSYTDTETSVILKDLVSIYAPGFTVTNVAVSSVNITVSWVDKPFWDVVKDLAIAANFDVYVDKDLDFNFFKVGSRTNSAEGIVHDFNLLSVDDFAPDLSQVRNKIIVYGGSLDGVQELYTAEEKTGLYGTDNADFGTRVFVVNNENINTRQQAIDTGEFELANRKDPPEFGAVTGSMLSSVQPGEKINISSPDNRLPPGLYNCTSYEDTIDMGAGRLQTKVFINKRPRDVSTVLKSRVENENKFQQTSINPENMSQGFNFRFDSDSGSHDQTEIVDGLLKPINSSGTWTSNNQVLTSDLTEAYLIVNGETLTGATISVSGDDGVNYQTLVRNSKITVSSAKGSNIRVKVVFSSADTQISSLSVLYTQI